MLNLLIALTIGFIIGILIFYLILQLWLKKRLLLEPAANKGAALEEAKKILQKNGYLIKEKQKTAPILTFINGQSHLNLVTADYIAEKGKKTFVVEVKTEVLGADPLEPLTRRQLLELQNAFDLSHSLIVDLPNQKVIELKFEFPRVGFQERLVQTATVLFLLLMFLWFLWLMIQLKIF